MDHNHHSCNHNLILCRRCDVVYCRSCSREWGRQVFTYLTYPGSNTTYHTTTADPPTLRCNHTTTSDTTTSYTTTSYATT